MVSEVMLAFLQAEYDKALISKNVVQSLIELKDYANKNKKAIVKKEYKKFFTGINEAIKEFDEEIKREKRLSANPHKKLKECGWDAYF